MRTLALLALLILILALLPACAAPRLAEAAEINSLRQENEALKVRMAEVQGMLQILPQAHQLEMELAMRKGFDAGMKAAAQIEMR